MDMNVTFVMLRRPASIQLSTSLEALEATKQIYMLHTKAINRDNHTSEQLWLIVRTRIPLLIPDSATHLLSDPSSECLRQIHNWHLHLKKI